MDYARRTARPSGWWSICRQAGATTYISGPAGARLHRARDSSEAAGIELVYFDYAGYPEYPQLFPPFDHRQHPRPALQRGPRATRFMLSFSASACGSPSSRRSIGPAAHLEEFYRRVARRGGRASRTTTRSSSSTTARRTTRWHRARAARRDDPRVRVIDLSRNFGHHKAMMTGLAMRAATLVFLIDSRSRGGAGAAAAFARQLRTAPAPTSSTACRPSGAAGWFERCERLALLQALQPAVGLPDSREPVTVRLMTRRYVSGARVAPRAGDDDRAACGR